MTSYTDDNGETYYVLDDGNTTRTLSEEEFEQQYPSPVIEWWTYDEYKNWLDNEKEALQGIVGEKCWTASRGEFVWTQEMVDEAIAEYEKVLQEIKDGMMYSKTVDGGQDIMVSYNPEDIVTSSKIGSTGGVVKSPFFKDMAVSKEVSPCPFSLLIAPLIYTG